MQEERTAATSEVATRPFEALERPSSSRGGDRLGAWDDLPVHQSAAVLGSVAPFQPGWAERFYFNLLHPTGAIVAILGGGIYPVRGVSECYFCRFEGTRQVNVRAWGSLPQAGEGGRARPFSLRCDAPLRDWSVSVDAGRDAFAGRFAGALPPYLYSPIDVPALEPGGEFDLYRHFVAVGRWSLGACAGLDPGTEFVGVRDRTWGVRTRRIRLHNWYVFWLGDACLTLIHQELADGSVFFSEAGVVRRDGPSERLQVVAHDLCYDGRTREVLRGTVELSGSGAPLTLEFERVGPSMRLAGAGYDESQGARRTLEGTERDEYELADPGVAARTGRGTMDAGARATVTGAWSAEGVGVVETALARNHVTYGHQIA
jgi:hypothetical protein